MENPESKTGGQGRAVPQGSAGVAWPAIDLAWRGTGVLCGTWPASSAGPGLAAVSVADVLLEAVLAATCHAAHPVTFSLTFAGDPSPGAFSVQAELARGDAGLQFWRVAMSQQATSLAWASIVLESDLPSTAYVPWGIQPPSQSSGDDRRATATYRALMRRCLQAAGEDGRASASRPYAMTVRFHDRAWLADPASAIAAVGGDSVVAGPLVAYAVVLADAREGIVASATHVFCRAD